MNLQALAADMASRVPAMALDCAENNYMLLLGLMEAERDRCREQNAPVNYAEYAEKAGKEIESSRRQGTGSSDGVTCDKCGGYVPGHASGAIDICTCDPISTAK